MAGVDGYDYYNIQLEIFGTWVDWLQAALQTLVGNIIRVNNLYQKMVIATENEDQQQVWYLLGRIGYYLFDIEPIEDAGFEIDDVNEFESKQHASLTDVLRTFNKLMDIQSKINEGEIQLEDQHKSYERSKQEFKRLVDEDTARHNLRSGKDQSPSMEHVLKKYGEAAKASPSGLSPHKFLHPLVKQDNAEEKP